MSVRSMGARPGQPPVVRSGGPHSGAWCPAAGSTIRTVETPIGPLMLVAGGNGLRAVLWPGEDGSRVPVRQRGWPGPRTPQPLGHAPVRRRRPRAAASEPPRPAPDAATAHLDSAQAQLEEYFAGTRREFDLVLDPEGRPSSAARGRCFARSPSAPR